MKSLSSLRPRDYGHLKPALSILLLLLLGGETFAVPSPETLKFAIMREGQQIGTATMNVEHDGTQTVADSAIDVDVKILGFTAYRYEHRANEKWNDGHLTAVTSQTDDNGTKHKLTLALHDKKLVGDADGKSLSLAADTVPGSVWNPKLISRTVIMNTVDGTLKKISIDDLGMENISIHGREIKAHHYAMKGQWQQDLWYDEAQHLVRLQFKGTDGSLITYRLM
jgi:hypothetical protein